MTAPPANSDERGGRIDISIFIPCFNEEDNVVGAIEKVTEACRATGLSFEVLVFDDASTDRTSEVVQAYQAKHPDAPVTLVRRDQNRGVATNFVDGAFLGRGEYFRLVCGDNVEAVEVHKALLEHIGQADIIVPCFTEIRNRPWHRNVISKVYTRLVNLASGYKLGYYNGCPIFRRQDVLRFHVESTGFGYQAEFLTRLIYEGRSYLELQLVAYDREGSTSINLKNLLSVANSLFTITLRRLRVMLFE